MAIFKPSRPRHSNQEGRLARHESKGCQTPSIPPLVPYRHQVEQKSDPPGACRHQVFFVKRQNAIGRQQDKERVTKRAARFARRPLVMFFLLSLQCRAQLGKVNPQVGRVRCRLCVFSVKLRCHGLLCQVSPPPGSG